MTPSKSSMRVRGPQPARTPPAARCWSDARKAVAILVGSVIMGLCSIFAVRLERLASFLQTRHRTPTASGTIWLRDGARAASIFCGSPVIGPQKCVTGWAAAPEARRLPAMSVPLHWTGDGLPCGSHFLASFGEEALLFRLAAQLETARPWFHKKPPV
jgi:hypothetical protein